MLVATDVAAKGLEFPDIKHVINFNMPRDVRIIYREINLMERSIIM